MVFVAYRTWWHQNGNNNKIMICRAMWRETNYRYCRQLWTLQNTYMDQDVIDQLQNINTSKPPGPDGLSPKVLKNIIPSISKPLSKLFNLSIQNKQLPKCLEPVAYNSCF